MLAFEAFLLLVTSDTLRPGEDMERRLCDQGRRLDARYLLSCGQWVKAEAEEIAAAGLPPDAERWSAVSQRVENAKAAHATAQREYIDHIAACPICCPRGFDS